jgi:hypothetical protein
MENHEQEPAVEDSSVGEGGPLTELEGLIIELKEKVSALRDGELDPATLEARLRELTELASRASSTLDSASR